jgi:asparagine synthase (glutamine-hydrolysing)
MNLATASVGVARLAITDLVRGGQPVPAPGGVGAVALNGAIYNARELVQRWGLRPATGNDAEVIWPLYRRFGLDFANYLEGMYAIIIVDDELSRVVLAVDPMGIKPLHMAVDGGVTWAASTLQALPKDLRRHAWRLPAGQVRTSGGDIRRIQAPSARHQSLLEALETAVTEQIPAEVEWGCTLSGGWTVRS